MKKALLTALVLTVAAASQASITMATFSDPSVGADSPLFTWDQNNNTISGQWTANGLTLETPGFTGGGSTPNVFMQMDPVSLTTVIPNTLYTLGRGSVLFYTNDINNPLFRIDFSGGTFLNPFDLGASQITGDFVSFTGPNVPLNLKNQQFSFSFANATQVGNTVTYTASFTSSADVVPEPATLLVLGTGIAAVVARRKRA